MNRGYISIIMLLFLGAMSGQNLKIDYEYVAVKGNLKNEVSLVVNDSVAQFVCDFKKKTFKVGEYDGEQEARYYINNFYMKSKRSFETTIFKNVKLFSEWEFNYEWTLTSETDVILGYSVRKAFLETNTKLGKIFAWFSTDIPLSAGPFRYNGLPGLILKISYEKINTTITAIEIVEMKDVDFIEFEKDGLKIDKETIINFDEIVLEKLLNKVK